MIRLHQILISRKPLLIRLAGFLHDIGRRFIAFSVFFTYNDPYRHYELYMKGWMFGWRISLSCMVLTI